jgi:hypothetical protein
MIASRPSAPGLSDSASGLSGRPVILLEHAVHLLRRAPAAAWIWHFAGSAPFGLAVLFFWNAVTNPRTSGATAAAASLGMALLLVWMNCCRAQFAIRLRALASGGSLDVRQAARLGMVIPNQSFLAATKLIVLPLSILVLFPLAGVVAYYRYAAALNTTDGSARARKLARLDQAQSWILLLLLQFLGLVVAVNVTLALALLPYGVRMLTGYESSFTRSGIFYFLNPLFVMVVAVVTWMVFDPLVQAVYTLRCFHLESLETGADLRAVLRRIRAATLAGVGCVLLLLAIPTLNAAISRERLEQSIQQAAQSPEYDWRLPPKQVQPGKSWLVETVDRMLAQFRSLGESIGDVIDRFIRWLMQQFGGKPLEPRPGAPPAGLHGSVYLLIAVTLAAAAIFIWRALRPRPATIEPTANLGAAAVQLDAEELSPDRLPEEQWIELAEQCLREENYRLALRALYLANLAWLGRREILTLHAGKTNYEYEKEMRRRGRAIPESHGLFAANIAVFERAWYGTRAVSAGDVGEFRSRVERMKQLAPA